MSKSFRRDGTERKKPLKTKTNRADRQAMNRACKYAAEDLTSKRNKSGDEECAR